MFWAAGSAWKTPKETAVPEKFDKRQAMKERNQLDLNSLETHLAAGLEK